VSKLVALDFAIGRRIDVRGVKHHVDKLSRRDSRIRLAPDEPEHEPLVLTLDQLATLLVQGDAELVDELDEPRPPGDPERSVNNIAERDFHRLLDWVVKVFLLRYMAPYVGAGPNTKRFRAAFAEGCGLLRDWLVAVGLDDVPLQTAWTTYQDLLKWRRGRYSLGALVVKGMQYCPWKQRGPHYILAQQVAKEVVYKNPAFSAARVYEAVNDKAQP
jgi:hypothetical protein